MKLMGHERFDFVINGRRVVARLCELDAFDVLGLANLHLRAGNYRAADALYRWQHRLQYGRREPPPDAA